jgi:predicted DNA-binding protein with PD1-like motif
MKRSKKMFILFLFKAKESEKTFILFRLEANKKIRSKIKHFLKRNKAKIQCIDFALDGSKKFEAKRS